MSEPVVPDPETAPDFDDLISLWPAPPVPDPDVLRAAAADLEDRQYQVADLLRGLADRREQFRRERRPLAAERENLRRTQAEADKLRKAAEADRRKARSVRARYLKRMKSKWAAERAVIAAERVDLDHRRRVFLDEVKRYEGEHAIIAYESEEYQKRLHDAWALLNEGQRRLTAERQETEHSVARREEAVRQRAADLTAREEQLDADRREVDGRADALRAEIARLELRAAHARAAVQQLEDRRGALEAATGTADAHAPDPFPAVIDQVPLDRGADKGADLLLTELHQREYELARERAALIAIRAELERRAVDLVDQRTVVAEQVASLATARHLWQTAEYRTVAEIEGLARGLERRELALHDRECEVEAAERRLDDQADELREIRARLEAWQSALTAHEVAAAAARDRVAIDLAAKRDRLARWESALATLCRKWATARKREVTRLRDEIAQWSDDRVRQRLAVAELAETRQALLAATARVAGHSLALEHLQAELTGTNDPTNERRLRVLRKKWESHFSRYANDIDARRRVLADETGHADDRLRELTRRAVEVAERETAVATSERRAESDRLARGRELDERAETLSVEAARAERTQRALADLRAEVSRMTTVLAGGGRLQLRRPDEPTDVIPLTPLPRAA